ncbi:MAG: molybdopterin molybdotransferase MoeA [Betaproteobacteria bacterium]|nr:molybdopterin molybdotransferase MoeA [Betaproteobacteria bacterium]
MNKAPLLSFDDALAALLAAVSPLADTETVSTLDGAGRVLATDLRSGLNVPPADNTQMDGYAVRVADLKGVLGARLRVAQRIPAGQLGAKLEPGTAARIFTGAFIPEGADAVVMQEQVRVDGDHVVLEHLPRAGEWVRRAGEDIAQDSVVLAAGTRLTPQATGLAASVGAASLIVRRRPRVACFFTGDELTMPGEPLRPGAIYNSNRFVLVGLLRSLGCEVNDFGIVPDSLAATRSALQEAARDADLILTSGGVSVGEEDHVKPAVEAEGELALWQIAMKPGKPLAFGRVRRAGTPDAHAWFIGLPGNPVSSFVTFLLMVRPFVLRLQGVTDVEVARLPMRADFAWPKPDRRREFLRVALNAGGGLDLFANQSSGVLTSTVRCDGLIDNPAGRAIAPGDTVRFIAFSALGA